MNILLLEDAEIQRENLKTHLEGKEEKLDVYCASNFTEAVNLLESIDFELFIVDINLGSKEEKSGFDLLKIIRSHPKYEATWVLITSGYPQHKLEAYDIYRCTKFLVKPIDFTELDRELNRTLENRIVKITRNVHRFQQSKTKVLEVDLNLLVYVEIYNKDTILHTNEEPHVLKRTPLKKIVKKLPGEDFFRCNRSYIINKKFVKRSYIEKRVKYLELDLIEEEKIVSIPVGGKYRGEIEKYLDD